MPLKRRFLLNQDRRTRKAKRMRRARLLASQVVVGDTDTLLSIRYRYVLARVSTVSILNDTIPEIIERAKVMQFRILRYSSQQYVY